MAPNAAAIDESRMLEIDCWESVDAVYFQSIAIPIWWNYRRGQMKRMRECGVRAVGPTTAEAARSHGSSAAFSGGPIC